MRNFAIGKVFAFLTSIQSVKNHLIFCLFVLSYLIVLVQ
jgi:hypothetical protein